MNQQLNPFKEQYCIEIRYQKYNEKILKYPNRIIIILLYKSSYKICIADPKQLVINFKQELFAKSINHTLIFVNNYMPQGSQTLQELYNLYKDDDGFLYIYCSEMETFGSIRQWFKYQTIW